MRSCVSSAIVGMREVNRHLKFLFFNDAGRFLSLMGLDQGEKVHSSTAGPIYFHRLVKLGPKPSSPLRNRISLQLGIFLTHYFISFSSHLR